jgi:hypothetical protein
LRDNSDLSGRKGEAAITANAKPARAGRRTADLATISAAAVATCVVVSMLLSGGRADESVPMFGIKIPPGYRDWRLISVAHEAGDLNDLRAMLGNDVAIQAYREGTLPFPDGSIIARLAWIYEPSEENNKVFGRHQSFVAGPPTNLQFMVKDSKNTLRPEAGVRSIRQW